MLEILSSYVVPISAALLMFVAGTDARLDLWGALLDKPRAVLFGSLGQLLTVPFVGLLITAIGGFTGIVAAGLMILSICPGGGISTYYCYVARASVMLSSAITALSIMLSLLTIPLWLLLLSALPTTNSTLLIVQPRMLFLHVLVSLVAPLLIGALVRKRAPEWTAANAGRLRWLSVLVLINLLGLTYVLAEENIRTLYDNTLAAALFVVFAMLLGRAMAMGLPAADRPVLVIESGVRNIPIALVLGREILAPSDFALFVGFLAGYFILEAAIMMTYAAIVAARSSRPDAVKEIVI